MSKLDVAKEKIIYLKFWLGIMIAVVVSLVGWLLSNFQSAHWLLIMANIVALFVIGMGSYTVHIRIEATIAHLEEL
jgi:uncharacterized membrane protein YcjF (UPF0283 family)